MLSIRVRNEKQDQYFEHGGGPIEFGRGPRRQVERCKVEDSFVSRDQLRVERLPDGRVRIENLSRTSPVTLAYGERIPTEASRDLALPVELLAGRTTITITDGGQDPFDKSLLMTVSQPVRTPDRSRRLQTLGELGSAPAPESLTHWLETVIALQRSAVSTAELQAQTARALVELIGLDLGMALLRRGTGWEVAARHATAGAEEAHFSRTLLQQVVEERRTFYQDLPGDAAADSDPGALTGPGGAGAAEGPRRPSPVSLASWRESAAIVVSPIFGVQDEVVGALYGMRRKRGRATGGGIRPLEAQVVQLLAAAAGANLARAAAARTRVQFEQFFSPELVRELERDANLLEGRNQEVTILVSDLRGFSGLSERLGPQTTCRLIRDVMERLSERIATHGGVIVDYAGDGILAMWNAPVAQDDHRACACRAALAMLDELPELNAHWRETVGAPLRLGIGVNTGVAQVGNTGSSRKLKYGPHGHTVNLASRVQDATKQLRLPLLITASTRAGLPETFVTRRLGQVRLPGIADAVCVHELHGETATAEWLAWRDAYEAALAQYEAREWAGACRTLLARLEITEHKDQYDQPALKLMKRAWECLESPPASFEPVLLLDGDTV